MFLKYYFGIFVLLQVAWIGSESKKPFEPKGKIAEIVQKSKNYIVYGDILMQAALRRERIKQLERERLEKFGALDNEAALSKSDRAKFYERVKSAIHSDLFNRRF